MKRAMISVAMLAGLLIPTVGVSSQAAAANIFGGFCGTASGATTTVCKDANRGANSTVDPVVTAIGTIIIVLSYVVGIAAIIGVIVSGIRMMVSSGDPGSFASARTALLYSLVGVALATLAQVIVRILIGILS